MWQLADKLKQMLVWELVTNPEELEAGRPYKSLAPPVGSKPQREDQGNVHEDSRHLYNWVKMLYEEGY